MFIEQDIKAGIVQHWIDEADRYILQSNFGRRFRFVGFPTPTTFDDCLNVVAVFKIVSIKRVVLPLLPLAVDNCQVCPFAVNDSVYGWLRCNLSTAVTNDLKSWEELPHEMVHEFCPLKEKSITVELK